MDLDGAKMLPRWYQDMLRWCQDELRWCQVGLRHIILGHDGLRWRQDGLFMLALLSRMLAPVIAFSRHVSMYSGKQKM